MTPRILFAGDSTMVAEFEERICEDVNDRVVACARAIVARQVPGVRDVVPTFRSVAVYFDPLRTDIAVLSEVVKQAVAAPVVSGGDTSRLVEIPVCYDEEFGPDLPDVALFADLPIEAVIATHAGRIYRVYMIGFVPGFPYMASVADRIAAPRRTTPRSRVLGGSVGIAGPQTGIYPVATPGGWNLVGRTPMRFAVDPAGARASLMCGDSVRFVPIDRSTFDRIAAEQGIAA